MRFISPWAQYRVDVDFLSGSTPRRVSTNNLSLHEEIAHALARLAQFSDTFQVRESLHDREAARCLISSEPISCAVQSAHSASPFDFVMARSRYRLDTLN